MSVHIEEDCTLVHIEAQPVQRRPGRRPGPSTTRDAILRAARRRFVESGYERATMRAIARDAGVAPSLVVQFFGDKRQLFLAATEPGMRPVDAVSGALAGADRERAGEVLARVFAALLADDDNRDALVARVRCAASEPAAAAVIREQLETDVATIARELAAGDHLELRAAMVGVIAVGFVMAREVVELEALAGLDEERFVRVFAPVFQRLLVDPI